MNINERTFGILIAYIIPGWVLLMGASYSSITASAWTSVSVKTSPTVAGFLFATLASIGLGVFISTIRWMLIDPLMYLLGVSQEKLVFNRLNESFDAVRALIDSHYRYYQFHANLSVSLPVALLLRWNNETVDASEFLGAGVVLIILLFGARDSFNKYQVRCREVLS
ncbi:hypothetical protein Q31b_43250 [Novipirellula aureliae]|uniref:Uncharacterized protein n=1 Tax=Novipirellula aureliae TaxID=2527966 RepID=A0A5C6DNT6_9BACT|nr:hypothetical protein [Novipirellula aureliae]TWU37537.1 hypothetical protein Q31b_43250 [Novipirellula aureliae]